MTGCFFPGDDVNQKVEHIGLCESGCDVGTLKSTALVLLGVNPCPHGQLCDEDVATLCEQDWGLGRYHLDLWIGLHDFLDARQR